MAAPTFSKMAAPSLRQLLEELLEPNNCRIRQATGRLREALEDPEALRGLAELLREAERPQLRSLAAVLLRRKLRKLPEELLDRLPLLLVEALDGETDSSTFSSLCHLGFKLLLLGKSWGKIPQFWDPLEVWLRQAAKDPNRMEHALRFVGVASPALPRPCPALLALCRHALRSAEHSGTLQAALEALGGLVTPMGERKTELLRSLVPDILQALQVLLNMDEDRCADALEILDEFLEVNPDSLIPHLRPMLEFCLQVAGDESRGDTVRVRALANITFLAQKRPRALLRGNLLNLLLRGILLPLCAEIDPENPDPEENWDEEGGGGGPCPRHAAAQVLDVLAQGLPSEKLLKELLPLLDSPFRGASAGGRKGALLALAAIARGCGAALRRRWAGPVLAALQGGLGDPEGAVRGAAAAAMRALREELQPQLTQLAAQILPEFLRRIQESQNSPNSPISDPKSWFVLETLLEALGAELQPWLPQVVWVILVAMETAGGAELGLSALHALACSSVDLSAHSEPLVAKLRILCREGKHQLQALEVFGSLGSLIGSELPEALELALRLAEADDDVIRVISVLAAAVSEVMKEGMAPLLPKVLPVLQGALRPPVREPQADAPDWLLSLHDDEEGEEPMENDITEWEETLELEVGGAFPGVAQSALGALGEMAENCGSAFLPYLDSTLSAILDLTQFPQSEVRAAAYEALGSFCRCGRGEESQTAPTPSQQRALQALVGGVKSDPEVGGALGAVGGAGRLLEPPGHAPREWLEPIGRALCDVIVGEVACAKSDDVAEDANERLAELREVASDWLPQLGGAMAREGVAQTGRGVAFPPAYFRRLLPSLLAGLADPAHPGVRSWAAAVIGQLGHALGREATPFLPHLGNAFRLAVRDQEEEVRANAFYAIGRLGEAAGHAHQEWAWPGVELCSHALRGAEPGRVRDNVLGALVRQQGAPSELVLPLLLPALPLTEDLEEEEEVMKFLLGVKMEELLPYVPEVVRGISPALGRVEKTLSQSLLSLLRRLGVANPEHFRVGVASLGPAQAAILDDIINNQ